MTKLSSMSGPDDWDDAEKLKKLLATRLSKRRVSLFLGAGVSAALKLPNWTQLIDNAYNAAGESRKRAPNNTRDADTLAGKPPFKGDPIAFAELIRKALYAGFSINSLRTDENPMLSALGAMVMSSIRGSAVSVVTFNYDDLLETYLRWRGFVVDSVSSLPAWNSATDVTVLHPHGWLPSNLKTPVTSKIVLTQKDYDRIVGDAKNLWHQRMTDIMLSTTPIFVGLSGNDQNLTQMLTYVEDKHPSVGMDHYWGIRFTGKGDENGDIWTSRGVKSFELPNNEAIPPFFMDICRYAAEQRLKSSLA